MRDKRDLVEADLDAFYHRDLRDLWRFDARGRRLLTLRMVYVRIKELPATSALARDANGGTAPWSMTDHLIADLWRLNLRHYLGKKAPKGLDHPGRPKPPPTVVNPRAAKRRAARMREARRHREQIRRRREES